MECIGGGRRYTEKKDAAVKSLSKQERGMEEDDRTGHRRELFLGVPK